MILTELDKITIEQIKLKSPINSTYDILRQPDKTPFLIQTPNLYLPFGVSQQYGQCLKIAIHRQQSQFRNQLERFEQLIYEKFFQKTKTGTSSIEYSPSCKQGEDLFYPPTMPVKIHPQAPPLINDIYEDKQDLSYILPGSWATLILCPKHLWYREEKIGITWYLIEARVRTPVPIIKQSLIRETWGDETLCSICYKKIFKSQGFPMRPTTTESHSHSYSNHNSNSTPPIPPEYQKYTKMLKLGIPLLAVIQKCQIDGLDPEILRQSPEQPKPNVESNQTQQQQRNINQIPRIMISANELKNGLASLEKVSQNPKSIIKKPNPNDPRIPSLDMIQSALHKLRKIK